MAKRSMAKPGILCAVALAGLAGCSSFNSIMEPGRIDYRSAAKKQGNTLEVPPDLTKLQHDSRYEVPEANSGTATASTFNLNKNTKTGATVETGGAVAVTTMANMHIERDGTQRWLVVNQSPDVLWPQVRDFWQELGFLINIEQQSAGVMETDWAENRAKIPQDLVRDTLGKVLDSLYSTGERDKFRTRLERGANGTTEIYISHRGAQEVLTGTQKDSTVWTARPNDPGLEAEFLSRLMARLGAVDVTVAKPIVAGAVPGALHAKLVKATDGSYVEVDEGFDRAWRRVGLALDRVGFTVEDRDRSQGTYFVRYVDQGKDAKSTSSKDKGFFARLFSSSDDKSEAAKYRILVKDKGAVSAVTVVKDDGKSDAGETGTTILGLLNDQLK